MKITKKALNENRQKNIIVDKMAYTDAQLEQMLEDGIIKRVLGPYVVCLSNVDKLDFVYDCGYICNVAVLKTGERIFITL